MQCLLGEQKVFLTVCISQGQKTLHSQFTLFLNSIDIINTNIVEYLLHCLSVSINALALRAQCINFHYINDARNSIVFSA